MSLLLVIRIFVLLFSNMYSILFLGCKVEIGKNIFPVFNIANIDIM